MSRNRRTFLKNSLQGSIGAAATALGTHSLLGLAASMPQAAGAQSAAAQSAAAQSAAAIRDVPYLGPLELEVDATDLDHHLFQVRQRMPVKPGKLTLHYPRFHPGTHGPTGNIERLAGLDIRAGTQSLPWVRDTLDPYSFHVDIPKGASEIELSFQYLSASRPDLGRVVITREMLNLQWISTVLYPAGHTARALKVQARVKLPVGWKQAGALRVVRQEGAWLHLEPTTLETLLDSPIFAGAHMVRVELDAPGTARPVALNLFADEPSQLNFNPVQLQAHRALVQQADKLFGSRHFRHYEFLLSLSDHLGGIGLEHHESSENGVRPDYFKDWDKRMGSRELLPHEYTHSWNGKFRRPADLATPNYNTPMQNSLLWLYEGQTQYWGRLLAARSGLSTAEQTRDRMAQVAATYEHRAGRAWRNLQDTTNVGTMAPRSSNEWRDWVRGADYYDEATLIWLDADTLIREKSAHSRSLDDFARAFFGVEDGRVAPLTYTFDDIVATLNAVQPHDWRSFLRERLDSKAYDSLQGLRRAGWQLSWSETPSRFARSAEEPDEQRRDDFSWSLGLQLRRDGNIEAVLWGSPAFHAGLSRAAQVLAVNGLSYKSQRLSDAISANKGGQAPMSLLVREAERYRTVSIDYRGGLRYPQLTRIEGSPERLDAAILQAR